MIASEHPGATTSEIYRGPRHVVTRVVHRDGRTQVLKTLRPGLQEKQTAAGVRGLRGEYAMLLALNAQNVPHITRVRALEETTNGTPVLVLDDAGPRNARDWLGHRPLAVDTFLDSAIQLGHVIANLHRQNVVHRDLNPGNIVMSDDGILTL